MQPIYLIFKIFFTCCSNQIETEAKWILRFKHVEFLPILCLTILINIVASIILLPFAYIKVVIDKSQSETGIGFKIGNVLVFFLFGPLILMFYTFGDCFTFCKQAYKDYGMKHYKETINIKPLY
jgi:hypothetical protein